MRTLSWKQMLLSLAVLGVMVWRVPFADLRAAFGNSDPGSLLLAVLSFLVLLFLRAFKWHGLMTAAGHTDVRKSLRSLFGGFALGLVTPGRLGELGRCVFVPQEERPRVALLTVYDRLMDFWALLTAMGVSLFTLAPLPAAVFGAAVWLACLPVVIGFPAFVSQIAKMAGRSSRLRGLFFAASVEMPKVSTPRFATLALSAVAVELASYFFLLRAFSSTGIATAIATYPYIVLAGDLPFSLSGMGLREGAAALLLTPYAVPSSAAIDASLVWFVFAMLLPAAIGGALLIAERVEFRGKAGLAPIA